jgi:hypothetical protein
MKLAIAALAVAFVLAGASLSAAELRDHTLRLESALCSG